jgi:2C-methyl-D-erythritol 2,4-cyclodiphosphate synthase
MSSKKMDSIIMENLKLTTEELEQVSKMAQMFQQTVFEIGSIENSIYSAKQHIAKLEEQKQVLFSDLVSLEAKEVELATTLREKYGDGTINPQTGEVTPA